MTARTADPSRFQFTGGLLERSIYVERPADRLLPEALLEGEYCHILAPRQIGKTSLCFRAARELTRRGVRCALVDVTAAGTPSTSEEWYFGLVDEIARRLHLPDPLDEWQRRAGVAPAQRFRDFVRALVERDPECSPIVIFLDEIEMVRLAPVDVDDFLLLLRSFHEERGQSPALRKLTFCLIGVTTPNDLIKNKSVTPFNVSKPVRVDDFTRAECDALAPGLADLDASAAALLDAVYAWTDGHPYMTMRACFELARQKRVVRGAEQAAVDEVVQGQFLERPLEDTNMNYAARRFEDTKLERDGARLADKIQLYRRVLAHQDPPAHNESAVQMELRICGMIKDVELSPGERVLRPRNRIYERALDTEWLRSKGERRFFSEAVWKWLDASKDDAALLRGVVLEKALAWAKTNPLSEDEQAFLDASLEDQRSRKTEEFVRVQGAKKDAEARLAEAESKLAEAESKLAEAESKLAEADAKLAEAGGKLTHVEVKLSRAETIREKASDDHARLQASVRTTRRLLYVAVLALTVVVVWAAVVAARLRDQQVAIEDGKMELAIARRDGEAARVDAAEKRAVAEEEARRSKEEAKEATAKRDAAEKAMNEVTTARDRTEEDLRQKNERVAQVNQYISRNQDLLETLRRREQEVAALKTENARLKQEGRHFATPPTPNTATPRDDPY